MNHFVRQPDGTRSHCGDFRRGDRWAWYAFTLFPICFLIAIPVTWPGLLCLPFVVLSVVALSTTRREEKVAQPYYKRLKSIVGRLNLPATDGAALETRHFFSGAALYANGKICATLGPARLALKLPRAARKKLIDEGDGK